MKRLWATWIPDTFTSILLHVRSYKFRPLPYHLKVSVVEARRPHNNLKHVPTSPLVDVLASMKRPIVEYP